MSKTSQMTRVEWNQLNWRKLERAVFKLHNRILKAAQRGDEKAVRKLQKTLERSWSAKCLAIRERMKKVHSYPDRNGADRQSDYRQYQPQNVDRKLGNKKGDRFIQTAPKNCNCTRKLSLLFKANKTANLEDLVPKIHTIIQDWRNQNPHPSSTKLLKRIYHDLHQIVMHWGRRRTGSYHRAYHLYWQQLNDRGQWVK